jgi:hypothetical protein
VCACCNSYATAEFPAGGNTITMESIGCLLFTLGITGATVALFRGHSRRGEPRIRYGATQMTGWARHRDARGTGQRSLRNAPGNVRAGATASGF